MFSITNFEFKINKKIIFIPEDVPTTIKNTDIPCCLKCGKKRYRHDQRTREILRLVIEEKSFLLKSEEIVLTRVKCKNCNYTETIYPDGLQPYKRIWDDSANFIAWAYIFIKDLTYRNMFFFYEILDLKKEKEIPQPAVSTFFRWVKYTAEKTHVFLNKIIKSFPNATVHLKNYIISEKKYKSKKKKILIERFCQFIEGIKDFSKEQFEAPIFYQFSFIKSENIKIFLPP